MAASQYFGKSNCYRHLFGHQSKQLMALAVLKRRRGLMTSSLVDARPQALVRFRIFDTLHKIYQAS